MDGAEEGRERRREERKKGGRKGGREGEREVQREGGRMDGYREAVWCRKISDSKELPLFIRISLLELARTFTVTFHFLSKSEYSKFLL